MEVRRRSIPECRDEEAAPKSVRAQRFAVVVGEAVRPPKDTQATASWLSRLTKT